VAITEKTRHRLYQRLGEVLGEEQATTLMEHLPPVGWGGVATKHDLQLVRSDLELMRSELRGEISELRIELRGEISELRIELHKSLQKMMVTMFASMVSFSGVLVAASHLA